MKKLTYIIMMFYYVLMGIDLWVDYLMVINIFSPPYTLLGIASVQKSIPFGVVLGLFILIILGLILFTTLAHFRNGKFKIISVILLILVAIGNFNVIFDFPTILICIILIASTFYISKEEEYIVVASTDIEKSNSEES